MKFPKNESFNTVFKDLDSAVKWATAKRKFGGCYIKQGNLYVAYWLPKNHPLINEFSW